MKYPITWPSIDVAACYNSHVRLITETQIKTRVT